MDGSEPATATADAAGHRPDGDDSIGVGGTGVSAGHFESDEIAIVVSQQKREGALRYTLFGVVLVVVGVVTPAVAHHGAATFDTGKEITLKGVVTEWIWANP